MPPLQTVLPLGVGCLMSLALVFCRLDEYELTGHVQCMLHSVHVSKMKVHFKLVIFFSTSFLCFFLFSYLLEVNIGGKICEGTKKTLY